MDIRCLFWHDKHGPDQEDLIDRAEVKWKLCKYTTTRGGNIPTPGTDISSSWLTMGRAPAGRPMLFGWPP